MDVKDEDVSWLLHAYISLAVVMVLETPSAWAWAPLIDAARTASLDDDEDEDCRRHGGADLDEDDQHMKVQA